MASKKFDQQLEELERLRLSADADGARPVLQKALRNRGNYLVSKAAKTTAALHLADLVPDLLAALDRFFENPEKADPQCCAKNEIIQALADLGYTEPEPFLRGLRHIQLEAVWGGRNDTAGPLRARSANALVSCRQLSDHQLLGYLVEALVDSDKTVRAEAAHSIGRVDRAEAGLLLRLRALTGDPEPEVMGACFSAIFSVEGVTQSAIEFVGRFLAGPGAAASAPAFALEAAPEAALALGMTRDASVVPLLQKSFLQGRRVPGQAGKETRQDLPVGFDPVLASASLTALALTNLPEALEFLIQLIAEDRADAPDAVKALKAARPSDGLQEKIAAAAKTSGNRKLQASVAAMFS